MRLMIRIYRLLKPVAVYTSYLFTALTLLYLTGHMVFPQFLPLHAGMLWGIFFFSLGSICAQRLLLGSGFLDSAPYAVRLLLYLCAAGIWGYGCLRFPELFGARRCQAGADAACFLLILPAGMFCCAGLELFNRCRAHMYNALLEQYKRRKQP